MGKIYGTIIGKVTALIDYNFFISTQGMLKNRTIFRLYLVTNIFLPGFGPGINVQQRLFSHIEPILIFPIKNIM